MAPARRLFCPALVVLMSAKRRSCDRHISNSTRRIYIGIIRRRHRNTAFQWWSSCCCWSFANACHKRRRQKQDFAIPNAPSFALGREFPSFPKCWEKIKFSQCCQRVILKSRFYNRGASANSSFSAGCRPPTDAAERVVCSVADKPVISSSILLTLVALSAALIIRPSLYTIIPINVCRITLYKRSSLKTIFLSSILFYTFTSDRLQL